MTNYWSAVNIVLNHFENGSLDRELTIKAVEDLRKLGVLSELVHSRISVDDSQTLVFSLTRLDNSMVIEYCLDTIQIEENGGAPVIVPRNEFTRVVERFYSSGNYSTLLEMAKEYGTDIGVVIDGTHYTLFFDHLSGKFKDTYTVEPVDFMFADKVIWADYTEFDDEYMLNRIAQLDDRELIIEDRYNSGHARGKVEVRGNSVNGYVWHLGSGKLLYSNSGPMSTYSSVVSDIYRASQSYNYVLSSGNLVETWRDGEMVGFVYPDSPLHDLDISFLGKL